MKLNPERVREHLEQLVAFASVSADGTRDIASYAAEVLGNAGHQVELLPSPNGCDANVIATNSEDRGLVLSGHLDVVPTADQTWTGNPFHLRESGGSLYGRGTSDMKGFVALSLALAEEVDLPPLVWALSWGEEIGCRGVRDLIPEVSKRNPWGCLVGEPTDLTPVIGHKGRTSFRVSLRGIPVHSSRADLGRNAIHSMGRVIGEMDAAGAEYSTEGPFHEGYHPRHSTVQVNLVEGGTAPNIVAGNATAIVEMRAVPGDDPQDLRERLQACLNAEGIYGDVAIETSTPSFEATRHSRAVDIIAEVTGAAPRYVPYSSEAGLFEAAGIPTVVCGPGSIEQAHTADEFITKAALNDGASFLGNVAAALTREGVT